jgi:ATP/maltotriose-dependent transcriptional regulator MalT
VLLLLARRQSLSSIEKELFIANGTVKAHIRHIYGKLGIHTRKELSEILGITSE